MTPTDCIGDDVRLYRGDCLAVLPTLRKASFDAVVTDPPYMIGAHSVGNASAKSGTWADMENSAWWFSEWFKQCAKLLRNTGFLCVFGNWRSLPTLMCAGARADLTVSSCVVWDKEWIGPAHGTQFRPTWELFVMFSMPEARIANRSESDVWRCKWMAGHSGEYHPAEKPAELIRRMLGNVVPECGEVLDPFMGSGTTGVAATTTGKKFTGIEVDPTHYATALKRLTHATGAGPGQLFAGMEAAS